MQPTILVIGAENPRIRYLFDEVARRAKVSYLHTGRIPGKDSALNGPIADRLRHTILAEFGKPDIMIFTWPQLAYVAERFPEVTRIYYCKDPFEHWSCWNRDEIHGLESHLLKNVDAVFAVSRALVEDFRPRTPGPVFYLPNGVEKSFLTAPPLPRPADLPTGKPILGCVGEINETYDWPFIAELADSLPEARLVFIGPLSDEHPQRLRHITNHLIANLGVKFLGPRPHEQLPAYLQHFNISLCPLSAGAYADRRSPLRLYDYLTTSSSILTTPIREAYEHHPHVHVARTPAEAAKLARQFLAGTIPLSFPSRQEYINRQSWSVRAGQFLDRLHEIPKFASPGAGITPGQLLDTQPLPPGQHL
jgi:hypothetical protein